MTPGDRIATSNCSRFQRNSSTTWPRSSDIPEPLKNWDFIHIDPDECAFHSAGNLVPLGPDSSGQHRLIVPAKTLRVAEEIEKRDMIAIQVEV